jgi:DNA polymerase-3 subunit beta
MKVVCTQENLNRALVSVSRIPKRDTTLPILNNILIEAQDNSITLSATDLEIGATITLRGKVEKEGSVTIPAQLITEYVSSLPHQNVEMEAKESQVKITCGTFSSTILGMKRDDFPLIPKVKGEAVLRVETSDLRAAINNVVSFSATDETRPEIAGIYCVQEGKHLTLAATDGFRLAEKKISIKEGSLVKGLIIPRQTLIELARMLADGEEASITNSESQIAFSFGETTLVSRIIEGTYPNYRDLVPQNFQTEMTVSRSELISTVRATSLFGRHNVQDVIIKCADNTLLLSSEAAQIGESHGELHGEKAGIDNGIILNSRYLMEGLSNFTSKGITLCLNSATEPAILRSADEKNYFYLLMPIKHV